MRDHPSGLSLSGPVLVRLGPVLVRLGPVLVRLGRARRGPPGRGGATVRRAGAIAGIGWPYGWLSLAGSTPAGRVHIPPRRCTTRACSRSVCACVCAATFRVCEGLHI